MKNSYVLLRNNIESASLSLEELQEIGLQVTDQIWVECQSVCWRNPTEIAELKTLLSSTKIPDKTKYINESFVNTIKTAELQPEEQDKKKHVYVALPINNEPNEVKGITGSVLVNINKYGNPEKPVNSKIDKKTMLHKPNADQPFDEINNKYQQSPVEHKKMEKTILGFELPENVKKISLYTGLVAAGALLMLLIMDNDLKNKIIVQPVVQQPEKVIATTTQVDFPENNSVLPESFEEKPQPPVENPEIIQEEAQVSPVKIKNNAPVNKVKEITVDTKTEPENIERKSKPANEPTITKKAPIENISSKVALSANDYNMGAFGGIKNLEITLKNRSAYLLDKITVVINYLNPEGKTVGSDNINFQSIGPGEAATVPVKKSSRGVKIDFKVTKIESKELAASNTSVADSNNYSKN